MRLLRLLVLIVVCSCSTVLWAGEYHLTNDDVIRGEPVAFDDDGMVVRLDIGGFSPRIGWSKLTQESLIELSKNPQAAKFVEPFIDTPPPPKTAKQKKDIVVKPVPRVERIEKPNFFASIFTPTGLGIFVVLFLANLYAAYEIAVFRQRPAALVCGLSILFPIVAPAIFLSMPSVGEPEVAPDALGEPAAALQTVGKSTTGSLAKAPAAAGGLSVARHEATASAGAGGGPQSYKRGEFTFNRRFFETKFPSFFRIVPNEGEVLVLRSAKEEHVAKRISRITSNEVHVQLFQGNKEVCVPFAEVVEVLVRAKDAKA